MTTATPEPQGGATVAEDRLILDDAPLNRFHLKITALTFCANFSDGYELGIIGIALPTLTKSLEITTLWQALLGSAALVGLFFGSTTVGWLADKLGRQRLCLWDVALIAVAAILQFFVQSPGQLLVLRLLIGFGIGADYALGPTLVAEFVPRRFRGMLLASLTVMWTVGYTAAFFLGNALAPQGGEIWRYLLASSAIPAILVVLLRIGTPESPRWLAIRGKLDEARAVARRMTGQDIDPSSLVSPDETHTTRYLDVFGPLHRRNTIFGIVFYNAQVIPYFAIFTFLPLVLSKMGLGEENYTVDSVLNLFLLLGGIAGIWFVAKWSRRAVTIGSFVVLAVTLLPLAFAAHLPVAVLLGFFVIFTFTMSAATNLDQVYPAELYPTELRGSGVGLLNGLSRIGSAIGTFLLPLALNAVGLSWTMSALVAVLVVGLIVSIFIAPETKGTALD